MKKILTIISLLLLSQSVITAQVKDTSINGFRTVHLRNKKKIKLLANIETLKDFTTKRNNGNYKLNKGAFGGADSMDVDANKDNQIIAIIAHYECNDTIYAYEQANYRRFYNAGKEYQYTSRSFTMKVTKWEDDFTIFELIYIVDDKTVPCPPMCHPQVYSVIYDKEYYYAKLKPSVDLQKHDNSIAILKKAGIN